MRNMDPLEPLFSLASAQLFGERSFRVSHGPITRFPEWMRTGPLESLSALCAAHQGPLQVAQGASRGQTPDPPDDFVGSGAQTAISGATPQALLRLGLTVVFANMIETVPAAKSFIFDLEQALGLAPCVTMTVFANAPSSGLPIHHDAHDQLFFQLRGTKAFTRSTKSNYAFPRLSVSPDGPTDRHFPTVYRAGFPADRDALQADDLETIELKPGSCFFMPAGTWHRTEQQDETCMSLAMAVRAPSHLDLLINALHFYAGQSDKWRTPAYHLFTGDSAGCATLAQEKRAEVAQLITELSHKLTSIDASMMSNCHLIAQIKDGIPSSYQAQLTSETFIRLPNTTVRRERFADNRIRLKLRCALSITDSVLEFENEAEPLFDAIVATTAAFSVSDLCDAHPDFEEEEVAHFCMQLCRAGLLRPISVPIY